MKKLTTIMVLTFMVMVTGLYGCLTGRPPEFSVSNPNAIPDGSGGVIVAYQVNNGKEANSFVQRLDAQGDALWGKKGIALGAISAGFTGGQGDFTSLIPDSLGNFTAVYTSDNYIWASKLDMDGHPMWEGEDTRKVSPTDIPSPACFKSIGNSDGETIIAWADSDDTLNLHKGDGNTTSYAISISTPGLDRFDINSDDDGNAFVIWKDNPAYSEGDIFVQKVDADGLVSWTAGGLQLTNTRNPGYVGGNFDQRIIADGQGGAVAILVQGVLSEDERKFVGLDLYAQRISGEGEMLWEENGVFITGMAREPRLIGNKPDSTLVFWKDVQNVYGQRLVFTGNTSYPEAGIDIGQAGEYNNIIHYYTAGDGAGGAVVIWNYAENEDKSLRAQRLDADGNKLWDDKGIKVSSVSLYWAGYSTPARISPDGSGGFFVTWAAGEHIKDKTSSYIQRISGDGELLWREDGIRLNP